MRNKLILTLLFLLTFAFGANAQFTQNSSTTSVPGQGQTGSKVNEDSNVQADTSKKFSFKHYFKGLAHKDTLSVWHAIGGSALIVGGAQIYNKDYWKLPIVYGGIGAGIYFGLHFNSLYQQTSDSKFKTYRTLSYAGAAAVYWAALMDGIYSYKSELKDDPAKATFYAVLCPGLGQAYNGDYWKIPIYYSGFVAVGYYVNYMNIQYQRFKYVYKLAEDSNSGYIGHITSKTAVYYRDLYRRYRDYGIVAGIVVYAVTIIDANVFAYMSDFEVNDDLSINVSPAVIPILSPESSFSGQQYASGSLGWSNGIGTSSVTGFQMKFKF